MCWALDEGDVAGANAAFLLAKWMTDTAICSHPGGLSAENRRHKRTRRGIAETKVAQTSKSVYPESIRGWSRVAKPAACATAARPADWEVGDTAGLETCATRRFLFFSPGARAA